MKTRFFLLMLALHGVIVAFAQQRKAAEYVITDATMLKQYHTRLDSLIKSGNEAEVAHCLKLIGDYYYHVNFQRDSLLAYYKKALQQYEQLKDSFQICYCRFRIGEMIAYEGKNPDESIAWHLPGAGYFERAKDYAMAAQANFAISTMYKSKGERDLREKYLSKAIELNKLGKDTILDLIILSFQCNDWAAEKNWEKVLTGARREIDLSSRINEATFVKVGLIQVANALLALNKPAEALPYLQQSATISNVTRDAIPETYRLLSICYLRLNRIKEAEKALALYKHKSDSIAKQKANDDYQKLLVQFETDKKQATIASLQNENKLKERLSRNQQLFIVLLASGLAMVLLGVWAFYRNYKKRQRLELELQQQKEQYAGQLQQEKEDKLMSDFNKQLAEVQLTALSAQMNPHFIFNCMNSIQKYILKNEKAKALEFLQNFSELMRSVLDNSAKTKLGLDEEIGMLEKYIMLEKQRLDDQFDYQIEISSNLQTDFFEVPGMVIQPYVENAIWHGLMNKNEKGNLHLKFEKQNGFLKCTVEDNGVGRKKAEEMERGRSPKRKSYGMAIAKKRLELLERENEKLPDITVEDLYDRSQPVGTKVTIYMPID